MNRVKVIGIGSPFGNDQLGWKVIEQLQHSVPHQHGHILSFVHADRPGTRLLEILKDTDIAILVDAIDNKDYAGEILQIDQTHLIMTENFISSHAFGVSDALRLGLALGELPDEIMLYGICVDIHDPRTIENEVIDQLCTRISRHIDQIFAQH